MNRVNKILFIYLLLLTISLKAQWFWVNPRPQGNFLYDICMKDANTGVICGDAGTFLRTTNGGINWIYQPVNEYYIFDEMQFVNSYYILAVGYDLYGNGVIYKSTNAGETFVRDTLFWGNSFESIFFINEYTGWIGGSNGKMLKTTNKGVSWEEYQTQTNNGIRSIHFFNLNTGICVCFGGKIQRTYNGGINWSIILSKPNEHYDCVYFYDDNFGFVTGSYRGILKRTTDGGNTWQDLSDTGKFGDYIFDIKFLNSQTGWLATGDAAISKGIFKSTDGGLNWESQNVYLKTFEALTGLYLCDSNILYAVGDYGTILKTTNSGNNWFYQTEGILKYFNCIDFIDENTGWLNTIFFDNTIYKSTDGGNSWDSIASFAENYKTVYFVNSNLGFAIGSTGKIRRTSDGGNTWSLIPTNTTQFQTGISFINDNTGWVCGSNGNILKTTNAGINFSTVSQLNDAFVNIFFINANTGWVTGSKDSIYKSTNGGINWLGTKLLFDNKKYYGIYFVNELIGWICGDNGIVMKTTNGGDDWIYQYSAAGDILHSMKFFNENTGYICGEYVTLLKTTDGGTNWSRLYLPNVGFFYYFLSLDFVNSNTGWVAGLWGIILKTTNGGSTFIKKEENNIVPTEYKLYQNYPNPFNSSTIIKFEIPMTKRNHLVKLTVFDITGREIATLVNNYLPSGTYIINFEANGLPSGIYFYRLFIDGNILTGKMVLIK